MENHPLEAGLCMTGNGPAFERALSAAVASATSTPFVYWEIGLGQLGTFNSVKRRLRNIDHQMAGIDVPEFPMQWNEEHTQFFLTGSNEFFDQMLIARVDEHSIGLAHFIFIDGCHALDCFTRDFLRSEQSIRKGGVIAIHDTDFECQHTEPQPHCGEPIRVRQACESLGLIPLVRPGWKLLEETQANPQGGRGCLFIQKL